MRIPISIPLCTALALLAGPASAAPGAAPDWTSIAAQLEAYPLGECVVCGADLAAGSTNYLHGSRLIRVCSPTCWETFSAGPGWYVQQIDRAILERQLPSYPLSTCAVCGGALDAGVVEHVCGTRLVRLCSKDCVVRFWTDPAPAMAAVDAAWIAAQRASYPTTVCPVMDMEVDEMGTPVEILHGTRLVRLCCDSCVETFREDPAKWLAALDELAAAGGSAPPSAVR